MASAELEDDQNYRIQSGKESNAKQGDLQNGGLDGTEMCIKQELVDDDGIVITDEEDSEDCAEWDEDDDDDEDLPGVVVPQLGGGNGVKRLKNQFTLKQKLEAMRYLETHSVNATSRFFGVATKSIREWRKKKDIIERLVRGTAYSSVYLLEFVVIKTIQEIFIVCEYSSIYRRTIGC